MCGGKCGAGMGCTAECGQPSQRQIVSTSTRTSDGPDTTKSDILAEHNSSQPVAILHGRNGLTLKLLLAVPSELVDAVLKVMSHAE